MFRTEWLNFIIKWGVHNNDTDNFNGIYLDIYHSFYKKLKII